MLRGINYLISQISQRAKLLNLNQLKEILAQPGVYVVGAYLEEKPIGMATICSHKTMTKPIGFGNIEDVVVDQDY